MTDLISRLYRYGKKLQVCNDAAAVRPNVRANLDPTA